MVVVFRDSAASLLSDSDFSMDRGGGSDGGACYYTILGIRKDASFSDVRTAYRKLALVLNSVFDLIVLKFDISRLFFLSQIFSRNEIWRSFVLFCSVSSDLRVNL